MATYHSFAVTRAAPTPSPYPTPPLALLLLCSYEAATALASNFNEIKRARANVLCCCWLVVLVVADVAFPAAVGPPLPGLLHGLPHALLLLLLPRSKVAAPLVVVSCAQLLRYYQKALLPCNPLL